MCVTVWVLRYKNKKKRGSGNNRVYRNLKLAPPGKRGSLGLEWLEGLLYQTPGTFSQQALLEALIVTRGSSSYFGEQ